MTRAAVFALALLAGAAPAAAQAVEISPFVGYRFGASIAPIPGALFIEDDGGVSFGATVDIPFGLPEDGWRFEVLFSRERADVRSHTSVLLPPTTARIEVDHLMIGGMQELREDPGRPFFGGLVGLSRYASPGVTEVRFTIGLAAGARFFATRNLGLRLDARGYMTIASLGASGVCAGGCVFALDVNPAFQADLTAGLIVAF